MLRRLFNNAASLTLLFAFIALLAVHPDAVTAQQYPTRNIGVKQVSVVATAGGTQVVPAGAARQAVSIQNHSTTALYCGPDNTVTTTTGFRIAGVDGAILTVLTQSAIQCISASGSVTVSVLETY